MGCHMFTTILPFCNGLTTESREVFIVKHTSGKPLTADYLTKISKDPINKMSSHVELKVLLRISQQSWLECDWTVNENGDGI